MFVSIWKFFRGGGGGWVLFHALYIELHDTGQWEATRLFLHLNRTFIQNCTIIFLHWRLLLFSFKAFLSLIFFVLLKKGNLYTCFVNIYIYAIVSYIIFVCWIKLYTMCIKMNIQNLKTSFFPSFYHYKWTIFIKRSSENQNFLLFFLFIRIYEETSNN